MEHRDLIKNQIEEMGQVIDKVVVDFSGIKSGRHRIRYRGHE